MDENKRETHVVSEYPQEKDRAKRLITTALSALLGAFLGSYFVVSQFALNQYKHHKCFMHKMMMQHMMPDEFMPGMMPSHMMHKGAFDVMGPNAKTPMIYIVMPEEIKVENGRPTPFEKKKR